MTSPIIAPALALVLWTYAMWLWMYFTRVPATIKMKMVFDQTLPNGQQMSELPARVRWKADNYNHLLEQPVLFYATIMILALIGEGHGLNVTLAWAYVGARVVHSLHQALWNKIEVRFAIFVVSSLIGLSLAVRAACVVFAN
jgi:hypothetical protein